MPEQSKLHLCKKIRLFQGQFPVDYLKVAEWYKGRMVLGGSGKVSFGRRIREDPLSPYSG